MEADSDSLDINWENLERLLQVFLVNTQWMKTVGNEQEIETKTQNFVRLKYKPSYRTLYIYRIQEKGVYWILKVFITGSKLWLMV